MTTNADEVVVGSNGRVMVAPTSATAPTDATTGLDSAFLDVGFISEDGASVSDSKEITDIAAWQALYPIRRIVTSREFSLTFALRQWNERTVPLAFGGGTVSANGDEWVYEPPEAGDLDERSLVLDWEDGDRHYRLYCPRGIVSETVETNLTRSSAADLPITFSVLPVDDSTPVYTLFTDDPAFATGS